MYKDYLIDPISYYRILQLHPLIVQDVLNGFVTLKNKGINIRATETFRSFKKQDADYQIGRTRPGKIITNAKGGESFHQYGLSFDFCIIHSDGKCSYNMIEDLNKNTIKDWMEVVHTFTDLGFEWGGNWGFKDNPHFQRSFGYTWQELLSMYKNKEVDEKGFVLINQLKNVA